jgi:RNase H-like domain found in reverse transcriptase
LTKTLEDHFEHVLAVVTQLKKVGFKINPKKCTWFATKVSLLGFIISGSSIEIDPKKIDAIKNRRPPNTIKGVEEWIGLVNFYRHFIRDFSRILKPLYDLKKSGKFEWSDECERSFNDTKNALIKFPILRQFDPSRPIRIYSDACDYATGGIFSQVDENNKEYNVEYEQRLLKGAELNYSISDKECLSVVYLIKKWRIYLYGRHFTVVTDHYALLY